jgi:hypothetical protein
MNRLTHHKHHFPRLVALGCLLVLLLPARAAAETYWLDGYEVEATLKPERTPFVLGEPIMIALTFENRADTDLELMLSGRSGGNWPDDYDVRVIGPDGETIPRKNQQENIESSADNFSVRCRRNTNRFMSEPSMGIYFSLDRWARIDKPGLYTVILRRGVVAGPFNGNYELSPETKKPRTEIRLETQIRVAEGGEERVGKLIEELSARMFGGDQLAASEASQRLASLDDGRIIKPFLEAFGKSKNAAVRAAAVRVFARFQTEEAFEGLRRAAADPDEDYRTLAATELLRDKYPKAAALLLSMRHDPYYGVRLVVLDAMEAKDTEASRRIIWEMTNDEHPMVRSEALRFLQERPTPSHR